MYTHRYHSKGRTMYPSARSMYWDVGARLVVVMHMSPWGTDLMESNPEQHRNQSSITPPARAMLHDFLILIGLIRPASRRRPPFRVTYFSTVDINWESFYSVSLFLSISLNILIEHFHSLPRDALSFKDITLSSWNRTPMASPAYPRRSPFARQWHRSYRLERIQISNFFIRFHRVPHDINRRGENWIKNLRKPL